MKRISISLITVALIAGMVGCGPVQYTVTIASTQGGSVTIPGEGNFTYDEGTAVNLLAEAHEGYRFVNWNGNVDTIANVNAASINIIVNGDYFITANFEVVPYVQYSLTITSTAGGSVTTPGVGTFTYNVGTVVNLVASATRGYDFVNWTGDVGTITNVNAAATNITMNDNYSIAANFALEIWDWNDLDDIRDNLGGTYILMNDLDSTTAGYEDLASSRANEGKGWQPIGTYDDLFTGSFDGQGYEIRDLFINRADESGVGLFGAVGSGGGIIKDIGVVNVTVTGNSSVGSLVGGSTGTVSNSYSTGSVTGGEYVGGLIGVNIGTVSNSYSSGNVTGTGGQQSLSVGGLVGVNTGTVSNSYSSGNVTGTGEQQSLSVGGLVAVNTGTVSNSYSSGNVTGTGKQQSLYVGGLVGVNTGTVSNSYSSGNVTGTGEQQLSCVGGLVGVNMGGGNYKGTVSNSHSSGNVTGTGEQQSLYVGGLVGYSTGTVSNSFWDIQTSGQATSAGGTGKTTAEMQDVATFAGWSIIAVANPSTRTPSYIWNIVDGQTYAFLSWEPVS